MELEEGIFAEGTGVSADVAKRKQAEAALRESQEALSLAMRAGRMGVWWRDIQTNEVWWSRELEEIFGLPENAFSGTEIGFYEYVHEADRSPIAAAIEVALANREDYVVEFRYRHASSQWRWMEGRGRATYAPDGKPTKLYGVGIDITERKRSEDAARLQAEKIKRLVESNIIGVLVGNGEQITEANDAFLAMVGYDRDDLQTGRLRWRQMTPPEHLHRDEHALVELHERGACTPFQKEYFRKNGTRVPILIGAAALEPEARSWMCFVQDMTPIKEVENELREADRRKDEFLATLAHELRNPLAPIRNAVEILNGRRSSDPTMQVARNMIDRQLQHMVRLIDDLLDVSRITRGKLQLRKEPVPLTAMLQDALGTTRPLLDHELTVSLPDEPIYLDADPVRLAQVFANLLNNACKYTEKGGRIWLTATQEGAAVRVTVKDTGIGIDRAHLPRLFRMFSQVESALERSRGGLGIGLSLARGLVEMHGGTITASSEGPGKGTEFTVRLPILMDLPARVQGASLQLTKPVAGHKILVVDDNHDGAESLGMLLELQGNEVDTAHDGCEALLKAEAFEPDVVLLDIGLPKMNGYEVCAALRARPATKRVVIVALTGWGQEEDRRKAELAGFDAHLVKPVDYPVLITVLDSLLLAQAS